jgi:hypothetical protein
MTIVCEYARLHADTPVATVHFDHASRQGDRSIAQAGFLGVGEVVADQYDGAAGAVDHCRAFRRAVPVDGWPWPMGGDIRFFDPA